MKKKETKLKIIIKKILWKIIRKFPDRKSKNLFLLTNCLCFWKNFLLLFYTRHC